MKFCASGAELTKDMRVPLPLEASHAIRTWVETCRVQPQIAARVAAIET